MQKRVHVYYSGYVQGVGFRYTIRRIVSQYDIVGWVRNLYDGRVELLAEGEEKNLKKILESIKSVFAGSINDTEINWSEATGEFGEFEIRF